MRNRTFRHCPRCAEQLKARYNEHHSTKKKGDDMRRKYLRLGAVALLIILAVFLYEKDVENNISTSFFALAEAIKNGDEKEIESFCTPNGLKTLRVVTKRYGQHRLGDYIGGDKIFGRRLSPDVVAFPRYLEEIDGNVREDPKTRPTIFVMQKTWWKWKLIDVYKAS